MAGSFAVSDDYEWTSFDKLSDALAYAEVAVARGDEDVQMFEEIPWRMLRPPDMRVAVSVDPRGEGATS